MIGVIRIGALLERLIPNALARDYRSACWLFVPDVIRGVGNILLAIITPLPTALLIFACMGSTLRPGW